MTVEQGTADAAVKIRVPRSEWMVMLVAGGALFVLETAAGATFGHPLVVSQLVVGCVLVAGALGIRTQGVDLTPEFAIVRRVRRRNVRWSEVRAVVQVNGGWRVRLILDSGEVVRLSAPRATGWGASGIQFERDFHRIGQWWIAHRGESWRPTHPEAP